MYLYMRWVLAQGVALVSCIQEEEQWDLGQNFAEHCLHSRSLETALFLQQGLYSYL